jgi:hypothetical protein
MGKFTNIARDTLKAAFGSALPVEAEKRIAELADTIENRFGTPNIPTGNESVAICVDLPKTAALSYDRIWAPVAVVEPVPKKLGVWGATPFETMFVLITMLKRTGLFKAEVLHRLALRYAPRPGLENIEGGGWALRLIAHEIETHHGIRSTPVFHSVGEKDKYFKPGPNEVLFSSLANLSAVEEKSLSWDQIIEFKKDGESSVAYREMLNWLRKGVETQSRQELVDEVSLKAEKYERALDKHGLAFKRGVVSKILAWGGGVAGVVTAASAPFWATLGGAGLAIGSVIFKAWKESIEAKEAIRSEFSEIAYFHDIKERID